MKRPDRPRSRFTAYGGEWTAKRELKAGNDETMKMGDRETRGSLIHLSRIFVFCLLY